MEILMVIAHENQNSLSHSLMKYVANKLIEQGHSVTISDLYLQTFNPIGGTHDFTVRYDSKMHYLDMQLEASRQNTFATDLQTEMKKLNQCDALLIFYPMWWYSYPAILKGWFDRVLAHGFAYGGNGGSYETGNFKNKFASLVVTLDGKPKNFSPEGKYKQDIKETLYPLVHGTLHYTGFKTIDPFLVYQSFDMSVERFPEVLVQLSEWLNNFLCFISETSQQK